MIVMVASAMSVVAVTLLEAFVVATEYSNTSASNVGVSVNAPIVSPLSEALGLGLNYLCKTCGIKEAPSDVSL